MARAESARTLSADLLIDYAAYRPEILAQLLQDAMPGTFPRVLAKIRDHQAEAVSAVDALYVDKADANWPDKTLDEKWAQPTEEIIQRLKAVRGWSLSDLPIVRHCRLPSSNRWPMS